MRDGLQQILDAELANVDAKPESLQTEEDADLPGPIEGVVQSLENTAGAQGDPVNSSTSKWMPALRRG